MVYRIVAVSLFIGLVAALAYAQMAASGAKVQIDYVEAKLAEQRAEAEAMRTEFERLRAQADALAKGPIPGLKRLTYDIPIELDDAYVSNIEFNISDDDGSPGFNYRLLLHNRTQSLIQPQVTLHLFDEAGREIAYAGLGLDEHYLAPNEKRSVKSRLRLDGADEPTYYRIEVR
jgi:hypothetical protein